MKALLAVSVIIALTAVVDSTAQDELTSIPMHETIIPTWSDVADTTAKTVELSAVQTYWERRMNDDMDSLVVQLDGPNRKPARAAVSNYYATANSCLQKHSLTTGYTKTKFDKIMRKVGACLDWKRKMPKFIVYASTADSTKPVVYASEFDKSQRLTPEVEGTSPLDTPDEDDIDGYDDDVSATTDQSSVATGSETVDQGTYFQSVDEPMPIPESPGYHPQTGDIGVELPISIDQPMTSENPADSVEVGRDSANYQVDEPLPIPAIPDEVPNFWTVDEPVSIPEIPSEEFRGNEAEAALVQPPGFEGLSGLSTDSTLDTPANASPQSQTQSGAEYPFDPASPIVPPFWAIDFNSDGVITPGELDYTYPDKLLGVASTAVDMGTDDLGKRFLHNVVLFHHSALTHCLGTYLNKIGFVRNSKVMDDAEFSTVALAIQNSCNVKFRYSLLAGPPPFEWISKWEPTASAAAIEKWFDKHLETARADLADGRVGQQSPDLLASRLAIPMCVHNALDSELTAQIDHDEYYRLFMQQVFPCTRAAT